MRYKEFIDFSSDGCGNVCCVLVESYLVQIIGKKTVSETDTFFLLVKKTVSESDTFLMLFT